MNAYVLEDAAGKFWQYLDPEVAEYSVRRGKDVIYGESQLGGYYTLDCRPVPPRRRHDARNGQVDPRHPYQQLGDPCNMDTEAVSKECRTTHHGCLHVADTTKPKREWRACSCLCHVATF